MENGNLPIKERATSDRVVSEMLIGLLVAVVLKRIGPEQVAHGPIGWWLFEPIKPAYVIERVYLGREAAVHAQKLLIHERGQWQAVERLHARVVHALCVLDLALLFECKVLGEMATLVVAAQQEERVRIEQLHGPQVEHAFDAEVAAVDVVAQEQVARVGWRAAHFEQLHEVVELTVHVTAHGYGRLDVDHGLLLAQ